MSTASPANPLDRATVTKDAIGDCAPATSGCGCGVGCGPCGVQPWEGGIATLEATLVDGTGGITVIFMGRRKIAGVRLGAWMEVEGMVLESRGKLAITEPRVLPAPPDPEGTHLGLRVEGRPERRVQCASGHAHGLAPSTATGSTAGRRWEQGQHEHEGDRGQPQRVLEHPAHAPRRPAGVDQVDPHVGQARRGDRRASSAARMTRRRFRPSSTSTPMAGQHPRRSGGTMRWVSRGSPAGR